MCNHLVRKVKSKVSFFLWVIEAIKRYRSSQLIDRTCRRILIARARSSCTGIQLRVWETRSFCISLTSARQTFARRLRRHTRHFKEQVGSVMGKYASHTWLDILHTCMCLIAAGDLPVSVGHKWPKAPERILGVQFHVWTCAGDIIFCSIQ